MSTTPDNPPDAGRVLSEEERRTQFAQGPPKLPRKLIWIAIAILAVLGVGGAYADQSFNVPSTSPPKTKVHDAKRVPTTIAQFVNLRVLARRPAPPVVLVDQSGRLLPLESLKGKAIALTFLDPQCRDICPVESVELRYAAADLGATRQKVAFVIVDANPHDVGVAAARNGLATSGLSSLPDVHFLSGSLRQLNSIWSLYGVTVEYAPSTGQLGHTNVIDIVDPAEHLDYALEPFANESTTGTYSLSVAQMQRFASGIALYLEKVLR